MKKLIHVDDHSGELRCDNTLCDYVAERGLHQFGPHLIGLPCPKCGENLLTEQDYKIQKKIMDGVDVINRIGAFFGLGNEKLTKEQSTHSYGVRAVRGKIEVEKRERP
jgi:hypothetical protein